MFKQKGGEWIAAPIYGTSGLCCRIFCSEYDHRNDVVLDFQSVGGHDRGHCVNAAACGLECSVLQNCRTCITRTRLDDGLHGGGNGWRASWRIDIYRGMWRDNCHVDDYGNQYGGHDWRNIMWLGILRMNVDQVFLS